MGCGGSDSKLYLMVTSVYLGEYEVLLYCYYFQVYSEEVVAFRIQPIGQMDLFKNSLSRKKNDSSYGEMASKLD